MSRQRPARRCRAHRTDGEPCRAYAIVGGAVCAAHGGRAPQVKAAAAGRLIEARAWRVVSRLQAESDARRALAVAEVLGLDPGDPYAASYAAHRKAMALLSARRIEEMLASFQSETGD